MVFAALLNPALPVQAIAALVRLLETIAEMVTAQTLRLVHLVQQIAGLVEVRLIIIVAMDAAPTVNHVQPALLTVVRAEQG